jgi:hypothetical protein
MTTAFVCLRASFPESGRGADFFAKRDGFAPLFAQKKNRRADSRRQQRWRTSK